MTKEEKSLLLQDLCARLPYGVIVLCISEATGKESNLMVEGFDISIFYLEDRYPYHIDEIKPYLRPMSSMTKEEKKEFRMIEGRLIFPCQYVKLTLSTDELDWLNKKMFDHRGLIEKGLVLEAPEGMY